tara:strand:- start:53 stop:775 length:723 start_codon:yes stop_codon:yes gene_type:complete
MDNHTLDFLESINFGCFALIDPDKKNDKILVDLIQSIDSSDFVAVLVGGSSIQDESFNERLKIIKNNTTKPIILFPGSSNQISSYADAILFTSLLSGRNPKYLVEEQVKGVQLIKKFNLDVISTGYILISNDSNSSVQINSKTQPLDSSNYDNILYHCLVAEYFGMKYVYLENGSGAKNTIDKNLITFLNDKIDIPIIVGGGIKTNEEIIDFKKAGAKFVVLGTILEKNPNLNFISSLIK